MAITRSQALELAHVLQIVALAQRRDYARSPLYDHVVQAEQKRTAEAIADHFATRYKTFPRDIFVHVATNAPRDTTEATS